MSPESLNDLVKAYVERYTKQFEWGTDHVLREQDINFWAWEEFERLGNEEPETAWSAILAVLDYTADKYTLGNLAAGPLEDLIDAHGEQFIERIELFARQNPTFKELLGGVWQSSTPEVWARIVRAKGG
jgi:hypothetical protein